MKLFQIGFLTVRLVDILDIVIVSFLFYKLFEIVRRSVILKIGFAVAMLFLVWKIVDLFDFVLLETLLDRFLGLGALAFVVLFAPEIRRISADFIQNINIQRLLIPQRPSIQIDLLVSETLRGIKRILQKKEGALIVFSQEDILGVLKSSHPLSTALSGDMLVTIFQKASPFHDGAVIVQYGEIVAVRAILPTSEQNDLPGELGTRHRAALGISEITNVLVVVISEEKNEVSIAYRNQLTRNCELETVEIELRKYINV
ncbi:MAG: diadenylate cyclase [Bacteroidia bacterium]